MLSKNLEAGQQYQEKLDFYLVALTFSILGLAVQSGNSSLSTVATSCELLGRGALLLSGLSGLYRLEGIPLLFRAHHERQTDEQAIQSTTRLLADGHKRAVDPDTLKSTDIASRKAKIEVHLVGVSAAVANLARGTKRAYWLQKIALASGLICLTLARSWRDVQWLLALLADFLLRQG